MPPPTLRSTTVLSNAANALFRQHAQPGQGAVRRRRRRAGNLRRRACIQHGLAAKLLRLQRRDYYRLVTAETGALNCIIHPVADQAIQQEVTVMDISIGGVALVCEQTGVELQPGMVYEHCQIELPGVGTVETSIEVKNAFEITDRSGKVKRRAGCVFVKPTARPACYCNVTARCSSNWPA
jgi:hypothetical protein